MKVKVLIVLFLIFHTPASTFAQNLPDSDSLSIILKRIIRFLEESQEEQTIEGFHYAGEWPSVISMRTSYLLLGKPEDIYDSNCFSTSAIHNSLASTYLIDPKIGKSIPAILEKSFPQILSFYNLNGFNFWPLLPPKGRISVFRKNRPNFLTRRPVQFPLYNAYIRRAANICNDNDDTAQGYLAMINLINIRKATGNSDTIFDLNFINKTFESYIDSSRQTANYYNVFARDKKNSGAYLTWRGKEESFPTWNLPRLAINNSLFLTPASTAFPYPYKSYLPYGANDVDAVVNANIMSVLSAAKADCNSNTYKHAADFITHKLKREKWSRAGVYYPNRFHVHYAVMRTFERNPLHLEEAASYIKKHLKESQFEDGSYHSRRIVNKGDILQSTAYAFSAMMRFGNPEYSGLKKEADAALKYLLNHASNQGSSICWDGGVFFSGGTVIRNTLYWKSDCYTTALILEAITKYRTFMLESLNSTTKSESIRKLD